MSEKETAASRRDFLKLAGATAPGAAAALAVGETAEAATPEAAAGKGLRKTEHVEKYLASARF